MAPFTQHSPCATFEVCVRHPVRKGCARHLLVAMSASAAAAPPAPVPRPQKQKPRLERQGGRSYDPTKGAAGKKTRIVVLGSGWGGVSFVKNLDAQLTADDGPYELVLVSPRNYFIYTPLLPSASVGTVDEHSIAEPVRNLIHGKGRYVEAECLAIHPHRRSLRCRKLVCEVCAAREAQSGSHAQHDHEFDLEYDVLIVAAGAVNNTFGVPGVKEHCFFLKSMEEARQLRQHVNKLLEVASLPGTSAEERARLLSFVVVGGGPSGVEVAAELHDLFKEDVARLMPDLVEGITITLVHTGDQLLNAYEVDIAEYTTRHFQRSGVRLLLDSHVQAVDRGAVVVRGKDDGVETRLPYGTCVWCTGIAMNPVVADLKGKLPNSLQTSRHTLLVDERLEVAGSGGTIFAIGDCAAIAKRRALPNADALFESVAHGEEAITREQLDALLEREGHSFPQLADYRAYLRRCWRVSRHGQVGGYGAGADLTRGGRLTAEEFRDVAAEADARMRPLPATAQVARQQAEYLTRMFRRYPVAAPTAEGEPAERMALPGDAPVFSYLHMGSLAYVGADAAVMKLPFGGPHGVIKGLMMGFLWRGMETFMQISLRQQIAVGFDFIRTRVFGRNMSDV